MIRDRASMFCGGLLALACALVLVFAGGRLLFVVSALTGADRGLRNDLNVARLAAAGLGLALGLIVYALAVARRARHLDRTGQLGMVGAGLMIVLAGGLLFAAFHGTAGKLAALDETHRLIAGHDRLADDVHELLRDYRGSVVSGFGLLLGAVVVLSLSLWALFWSRVVLLEKDRLSRPLGLFGTAGALAWASLLAGATFSAAAAIDGGPPTSNPAFEQVLDHVRLTLLLCRGAAVGLTVYGLAILIFGLAFRVQREVL